jgi:hypothetical protein
MLYANNSKMYACDISLGKPQMACTMHMNINPDEGRVVQAVSHDPQKAMEKTEVVVLSP